MNLKQELESRGFLNQYTHEEVFPLYEKGGQTLYVGMDPTADSLHLGNFVGFMHAVQYMRRGNKLIFIVGGATGMVGDPGGKNSERTFLDEKTLQHNVEAITEQVGGILSHLTLISGDTFDYEVKNNLDFYEGLSYIGFLRDIGKNMTINQMMNKETVKRRIEDPEASISYTEFSYMLMQGYDFLQLFEKHDCKLQIAGSDQRGNIVTGIELIRKKLDKESYGVTCPLLVDSTGKKFGKSEGNALWLNPLKTTPYEMYQYFLNTNDEDVEKFLKILTLLTMEEVEEISQEHKKKPELRYGQKNLAKYVVTTIFGQGEADVTEKVTDLLFGGDVLPALESGLDDQVSDALCEATGGNRIEAKIYRLIDLLVMSGLAQSNGEAKKMISSGAVSVFGEKITEIGYTIEHSSDTKRGGTLIRKGKKKYVFFK